MAARQEVLWGLEKTAITCRMTCQRLVSTTIQMIEEYWQYVVLVYGSGGLHLSNTRILLGSDHVSQLAHFVEDQPTECAYIVVISERGLPTTRTENLAGCGLMTFGVVACTDVNTPFAIIGVLASPMSFAEIKECLTDGPNILGKDSFSSACTVMSESRLVAGCASHTFDLMSSSIKHDARGD